MVMDDIRQFQKQNNISRSVMIWCGSTEVYHQAAAVHQTLESFETGLRKDDPEISPSQIYAYAALKMGIPPRQRRAAHDHRYAGAAANWRGSETCRFAARDYKSGQTFMKTLVAPGLKSRLLGVKGLVLDQHPGQSRRRSARTIRARFRSKEVSKSSALEYILQGDLYPDLYKSLYHKVRIEYYPPRGDAKEGWGQYRHLRVARLSDADQDQLPVPRLHPGRAADARHRPFPWTWRSAAGCGAFRNGCRSTSRPRCTRTRFTRSTTFSSSS